MVKFSDDFINFEEKFIKETYDKYLEIYKSNNKPLKIYEAESRFAVDNRTVKQKLKTEPIDWKKVALFNPKILT